MCFAMSRCAESLVAVRTFEGFGAGVQAHVHLQAAFSGKRRAAHVAHEQLLTYTDATIDKKIGFWKILTVNG